MSTFGAPAGGRSGSIGGNDDSGSFASKATGPPYGRSGIGSTVRLSSVTVASVLIAISVD